MLPGVATDLKNPANWTGLPLPSSLLFQSPTRRMNQADVPFRRRKLQRVSLPGKTMTVERCVKQGGTVDVISDQKWCTTPIKAPSKN
jgi:hypothetical protein